MPQNPRSGMQERNPAGLIQSLQSILACSANVAEDPVYQKQVTRCKSTARYTNMETTFWPYCHSQLCVYSSFFEKAAPKGEHNLTKDKRTLGSMEKSQQELKRTRLCGKRYAGVGETYKPFLSMPYNMDEAVQSENAQATPNSSDGELPNVVQSPMLAHSRPGPHHYPLHYPQDAQARMLWQNLLTI